MNITRKNKNVKEKCMNKILSLIFSMLLVGNVAHAVELSLDDALKFALERNEDIKIADLTAMQSNYIVREVESAIYPTITAKGQYLGNHNYSNPHNMPSTTTGRFNAGASIEASQLLFAFGMIENAIEAAALAKDMMYTQKDTAITSLRYSIRNAYFAVLVYEANYEIAKQSYQNALNTKKKLETSASVRMSQSDLIKVDADIASRKPSVDSAKMMLEQGYRLLEVLCVLDEPITKLTTQYDDMEIAHMDFDVALTLIDSSPTVKLLTQQVKYSEKMAEAKRDTDNPTVALSGSYSLGDTSIHPYMTKPNWTAEGMLGIFATIPLYDGGKAEAQGMQEDYNARINHVKLMQTKRNLENALKNAFQTYTTNIEVLKMDDEAIKLANRSYELSLSRFLTGQTSAVELNDVESGLTQLKMKRISTINSIFSALAEIEQIVGEI